MTDTTNIPTMTPVESSNIKAVGYDEPSKTMHIQFKSGGHYRYSDVPADAVAQFMAAESKGVHFSKQFAGKYKHEKLA